MNRKRTILLSALFAISSISIASCGNTNTESNNPISNSVEVSTSTTPSTSLDVTSTSEEAKVFSVDDLDVLFNDMAIIKVNNASSSKITYTFEGENIDITDGIVTGLVGNTTTEVTATCGNDIVKFNVNVKYELPFGKNVYTNEGSDLFTATDNGVFEKESGDYAETYLYEEEEAFAGNKILSTGKIVADAYTKNSYMNFILKASETQYVNFAVKYDRPNKNFILYSEYKNGEELVNKDMTVLEEIEFNYAVLFNEGVASFFIDEVCFAKVETTMENAHFGFSANEFDIEVSKIRNYTSGNKFDQFANYKAKTFGAHAYNKAASNGDLFVENVETGEYVKSVKTFSEAFFYYDDTPVAGNNYSITFDVSLSEPNSSGLLQSTFIIAEDDGNMARLVLDFDRAKNTWFFFSDARINGTFGDWISITEIDNPQATIKVVYNNGICQFYINDILAREYNSNFGVTHVGVGGEGCVITISNVEASN